MTSTSDATTRRSDRLARNRRRIVRQAVRARSNAPAEPDEPRWRRGERAQILERLGVS